MQFPFNVICLLFLVSKIYLISFSMIHKQSCFLILPCCYCLKEEEERKVVNREAISSEYIPFGVCKNALSFILCS